MLGNPIELEGRNRQGIGLPTRMIIPVLLVGLVIGGIGGYFGAYVTYQSRISILENEVEDLHNIIADLTPETLHTYTLHWETQLIPSKTMISGYVDEWSPDRPIRVMQLTVWMGNPHGILWEGDAYITLAADDSKLEDPDQLIFHYQFDSHAPSPIPHLYTVNLGPGFFEIQERRSTSTESSTTSTMREPCLAMVGSPYTTRSMDRLSRFQKVQASKYVFRNNNVTPEGNECKLLRGLRFLGLVDENGDATDDLRSLHLAGKFSGNLEKTMIRLFMYV